MHGKSENNRMVFSQPFWAKTATIIIERVCKGEKQREILSFDMKLYEIIGNFSSVCFSFFGVSLPNENSILN